MKIQTYFTKIALLLALILNTVFTGLPTDTMNIAFPKGPKGELFPIVINAPPPKKQEKPKVADKKLQQPIIFVPLIRSPSIKKRVILHHSLPQNAYYSSMINSYNQYYENMAKENQYYQDPGIFEGRTLKINI